MPTQLQKQAFDIKSLKVKERKPIVMGDIMVEAGYSEITADKPKNLTESTGWQTLLAKYDDEPIMDLIYEEALDKSDKRNATANRDILLKLKDRYPAQKSKVIGLFGGLSDLE